ncbi:type II toxin-antitoxin system HicB family antitoxin, partial [Streptococcus pyogenes]
MLKSYPAIFHKENDDSYWIEFPDFSGGTQGDNIEEGMKNAREMLEGVVASYLDEGLSLPHASDIQK